MTIFFAIRGRRSSQALGGIDEAPLFSPLQFATLALRERRAARAHVGRVLLDDPNRCLTDDEVRRDRCEVVEACALFYRIDLSCKRVLARDCCECP